MSKGSESNKVITLQSALFNLKASIVMKLQGMQYQSEELKASRNRLAENLVAKVRELEHFANNLQNYFIHQVKILLIFIQIGYNFFMKNYSKTERIKAIRAVLDKNISTKQVALIFQCHVSTVYRWVDEYIETGKTQPAKSGEPPKKLDKTDEAKIQELVAAKKDITLAELVEAVGKNVSIATMHRCLQRIGITYKKNSKSRRTK